LIEKNMKILDIIAQYPETQDVFRGYDEVAGVCVMCNHLFDSLETLCLKYDIEINRLISQLSVHC